MRIHYAALPTPVGTVRVGATETGLCSMEFEDRGDVVRQRLERRFPGHTVEEGDPFGALARLERYLGGDFSAFEGLALDAGGTDFQRRVWRELVTIPAGTTSSYGEIAARLGTPSASRAVGAANGQNPIAIAVPCHRVIGANGTLTGYAGGVDRKRWLLVHEGYLLA